MRVVSFDGNMNSRARPPEKARFLAVDFFCGAGGTTRGLIDAGGYVIAGVDKDEACGPTYSAGENNRNVYIDRKPPKFLCKDIFPRSAEHPEGQQHELFNELDYLIECYRGRAKRLPLLFAICAPCQPFTRLARSGMSEEREAKRARDAGLLKEACRFVRRYKPEMVLSENVSGIDDPKYGGVWADFRKRLKAMGYATGSKVVCTSKFGVPQFRKRSILMGIRRDLVRSERFADLYSAEVMVPESDPDAYLMSVEQAIGHLPPLGPGEVHPTIPNHRVRGLSELNYNRLAAAVPGESNAYMEDTDHGDLSLRCHRDVNRKLGARCFGDVYTRMRPDRPSPTITTRCISVSNGRFGHYDVSQVRAISVREAALLQSFPDTYTFFPEDEMEPAARMVGNAVPPKLARFFADYLVNSLDRRPTP